MAAPPPLLLHDTSPERSRQAQNPARDRHGVASTAARPARPAPVLCPPPIQRCMLRSPLPCSRLRSLDIHLELGSAGYDSDTQPLEVRTMPGIQPKTILEGRPLQNARKRRSSPTPCCMLGAEAAPGVSRRPRQLATAPAGCAALRACTEDRAPPYRCACPCHAQHLCASACNPPSVQFPLPLAALPGSLRELRLGMHPGVEVHLPAGDYLT